MFFKSIGKHFRGSAARIFFAAGATSAAFEGFQQWRIRTTDIASQKHDKFSQAESFLRSTLADSHKSHMQVQWLADPDAKIELVSSAFQPTYLLRLPTAFAEIQSVNDMTTLTVLGAAAFGYTREKVQPLSIFTATGTLSLCHTVLRACRFNPIASSIGAIVSFELMRIVATRELILRADARAMRDTPALLPAYLDLLVQQFDPQGCLSANGGMRYVSYMQHHFLKQRITSLAAAVALATTKRKKASKHALHLLSTSRVSYLPIDPTRLLQNPIANVYNQGQLLLPPRESGALTSYEKSASIFIYPDDEMILKNFFQRARNENSPLGKLYQTLAYDQFLRRLVEKRFKSAYLDGRMLLPRHSDDVLDRALSDIDRNNPREVCQLLQKIGSTADQHAIFKQYLSLSEIAVASLLMPQMVTLAIDNGSRKVLLDEKTERLTWDPRLGLIDTVQNPIVVASPSGIECRNGTTVHPDLFMVALPAHPNALWHERAEQIRASVLYSVAPDLYGKILGLDVTPQAATADKVNFAEIADPSSGTRWYLCLPAYKQRAKKTLRLLLTGADKQMQAHALGTSFNLQGLGLGYFGFSFASDHEERLLKEALFEVLSEERLQHITQVNLLNWPSKFQSAHDTEQSEAQQPPLAPIKVINGVRVTEGCGDPLSRTLKDSGSIGGTHSCGDSAAYFGNEAYANDDQGIHLPRSSSGDTAMFHSVLFPKRLMPPSIDLYQYTKPASSVLSGPSQSADRSL